MQNFTLISNLMFFFHFFCNLFIMLWATPANLIAFSHILGSAERAGPFKFCPHGIDGIDGIAEKKSQPGLEVYVKK